MLNKTPHNIAKGLIVPTDNRADTSSPPCGLLPPAGPQGVVGLVEAHQVAGGLGGGVAPPQPEVHASLLSANTQSTEVNTTGPPTGEFA